MMYAAMGRFYDWDDITDELSEEIGRRIEAFSALPKGKYKYVYIRPDDNNELEAFNNVECVSLGELLQDKNCGEEAPKLYKGRVINCTRLKGHDGAHVVMSSFLGMGRSADCAWEEY